MLLATQAPAGCTPCTCVRQNPEGCYSRAVMRRSRTLLSVLLGLVLLVQGLAVSAAPQAWSANEGAGATAAAARPPCNMQTAEAAADPSETGHACCDASCPDMARCVLGHMAAAATLGALSLPSGTVAYPAPAAAPVSQPPRSPLRPPIAIHG
ncbi:MAG: hypothetical protein AB1651_12625 [Pseudomonadota bacterium]